MMKQTETLRRFAAHLPMLRDLAHDVPPYHTGSVGENRLGLQLFRFLWGETHWRLRPHLDCPGHAASVIALQRDGYLAIPDFLPAEAFHRIRLEFQQIKEGLVFRPLRGGPTGRIHSSRIDVSPDDPRFCAIWRYLAENALIADVISAAARRRVGASAAVTIDVYRIGDDRAPENDIENVLHADLHLPTFKAWYYLDDVDETNGALIYAPGSHRLTIRRLSHEYDMSVRTAKLRRGDTDIPDRLLDVRAGHKRNKIAEEHAHRMKLSERSLCGRGNTLVIANTRGFHRRGAFVSQTPRAQVMLNYRTLEGKGRP